MGLDRDRLRMAAAWVGQQALQCQAACRRVLGLPGVADERDLHGRRSGFVVGTRSYYRLH